MFHSSLTVRRLTALVWTASLLLLCPCESVAAQGTGVQITDQDGKLRIEIEGQLFSEYHYSGFSRPFLYPVLGPGGLPMTRNWPMKEVPGEERDHPHQRSFWWAHGALNGHDFWSEGANAGRTLHDRFLDVKSGPEFGLIRAANRLVAKDGTLVATDERTIRIHNRAADRIVDFQITVHASQGPLVFGDTKEGTMALRLNESMRLVRNRKPGEGRIVNSEGLRDGETWGKRAAWVDYSGPAEGQTVGVAIFDHPRNPRHPTHWHVRDYGLFAANPFGIHDFEKQPPGTGDLKVAAGESVTWRYRFYFHRGDEQEAKVAERYADYARDTPDAPATH